jgi:L-alanine-DL-glutamate epimerase-like enolase superfamily enzyme
VSRTPPKIARLEAAPLDAALKSPFVIASSRIDTVTNVAVRVVLVDGSNGWGEIAVLPEVTTETQRLALQLVEDTTAWIVGRELYSWRQLCQELSRRYPAHPAFRAGVEMALIDGLCRSLGIPLYAWFGGASRQLTTDITIPICGPEEAAALAEHYRQLGFERIKTKVGLDADEGLCRLAAIVSAHPSASLILDANEGFSLAEALDFIGEMRSRGIKPILFEQPVSREQRSAMARLSREAGIPIAADESCRSVADAMVVVEERLAQVINIKLAKIGLLGALEVHAIARGAGLGLMIGGMVETRLGMGCSAHLAAGLGGFDWIDLDTPLLLARDPIIGGCPLTGPHYDLRMVESGHGAQPKR